MMRSVRKFFARHFLSDQRVENVSQVVSAGQVQSYSGGYNSFQSGNVAISQYGGEGQIYNSANTSCFDDYVGTNGLNTQRVSDFYGDSAQFNCLAANNYGVCGLIGHNGTPTFWKWDNAQGCMVPHVVSTPLIRRFQRSFAAFLSSWRLG